jgi:exonuclease III
MGFNIATINVEGLSDKTKVAILSLLFTQKRMYFFWFIQESHVASEEEGEDIGRAFGASSFWSYGQRQSKGVGILLNNKYKDAMVPSFTGREGRLVGVDINPDGVCFCLINVYLSNDATVHKQFIDSLAEYTVGNKVLNLGGDFNFVENVSMDKAGGNPTSGSVGKEEMSRLNWISSWKMPTAPRNRS